MGAWKIELDDGRTFVGDESQTLLESASAAGHGLPFGCGHGACRTCGARLLSGRVAMAAGSSLTSEQARGGFLLLCVAYPRSDLRLEVGEQMGLLPVLPWTE